MNFEFVANRLGTAAIAKLLANIVSWGSTIFLIRWLSPADYGIVAIAAIYAEFLFQFVESAVSADIVRRGFLSLRRARLYTGSVLLLSAILAIVLLGFSPVVSSFYAQSTLALILALKAFELMISALTIVPEARLLRSIDTKMQGAIIFIGTVVGALAALVFAINGAGLWSLLVGAFVLRVSKLLLFYVYRPQYICRPHINLRHTKNLIIQNLGLIGNRMAFILYEYIPTMIAGRRLGPIQTGIYFTSYDLASILGNRVMNIVNQVALPVYSRLKDDKPKLQSAILRALGLLTLIYWPCIVGLAAVSDLFVEVVLGPKWTAAIPVLAVACLAWAARSPWDFVENAMIATNHERLQTIMQLIRLLALVTGCFALSHLGALGFGFAYLGTSILSSFMMIVVSCRALGIDRLQAAICLLRGLFACAAMGAAVRLSFNVMTSIGPIAKLLLGIAVGVIAYVVAVFIFQRPTIRDFKQLVVHGLLKRNQPK